MKCFGDFNIVFPTDKKGIRTVAQCCLSCPQLKACFSKAMDLEQGLRFKEERIDEAYQHGLIGVFQRWSEKKQLQRRIKALQNMHKMV
ncbi:MAG: hypothetical protein V1753_08205 [Pseudomonadota bacterium]